MKPSARVALIAALAATTAPTWASLRFYSPDYTFDSTTGTGFKYYLSQVFVPSAGITPDGRAAHVIQYYESNAPLNYLTATWRGQSPLPTPQEDSDHLDPYAIDINRYGWMCGNTTPNGGGVRPALWRPDGTRIDLPVYSSPFPNEPGSGYAFGMNDASLVVGQVTNYDELGSFGSRPVYWSSSFDLVELENPFATSNQLWFGEAISISSNGIVAGTVRDGGGFLHAMRWDINGTAPILSQTTNTGITFTRTEAEGLLDDGTILGLGRIGNTRYGILWTPDGNAIELRNLPNSTNQTISPHDINNNHHSIGSTRNSLGQQVGVRWSPTGEPMALDRLPDAPNDAFDIPFDINDFDFVVGRTARDTYEHAVLWTPDGDAIDMNTLVESNGEWNFIGAGTITNTGWISGVGSFDPSGPAEAYRRPFSILVPFVGTYGMGDANFDESIDFADLLIVAQNYGTSTNGSFDVGDFNLDGSVDFNDLLAIAQNYGNVLGDATGLLPNSPNPTFESDWQTARGMVPEPVAASLIMAGLVMLKRRR